MSRLRRLTEEDHFKRFNDDMYHNCRWCKHSKADSYGNFKCYCKYNNCINEGDALNVYKIAEEGYLDETLRETIGNETIVKPLMHNLEKLLDDWGISQKRKKEFKEQFIENWEDVEIALREELEESVSVLYQSKLGDYNDKNPVGITVSDDYCCKYFE